VDTHDDVRTAADFGREIRRHRKAAGLTQEDLAIAAGTTRRLISALEKADRAVSLSIAMTAATELGLDLRLEPRR
jgi:transcriptional regulator with XRE-family HTH domain